MTRLAFVRHGETDWNSGQRLQGQQDIELSPRGRLQVEALRPVVESLGADRVVRSPLVRCTQTAELLGVDGTVDPRWMEADLGDWTGLTKTDVADRWDGMYAAWRAGTANPPGGESLEQLRLRVGEALADLPRGDGGTTLVVTHGGPIRAVCQLMLGLETGQLVPVLPASLTVVDVSGPRPRLAAYNVVRPVGNEQPAPVAASPLELTD